jgi:hypothetical protein
VPTGSGLDAQIMFAQETTWGTAATPTRSVEFNDESLNQDITYVDSAGLRAGNLSKRTSRTKQSRFSVGGDVTMELASLGMGLFVKHMLGSSVTTPTVVSGSAYKQIHTPSGLWGFGLTAQVGRPEPSTGTVKPFTYAGCKVTGWEISVKDGGIATLKLTLDGKSETTATALATTAFLTGSTVYSFRDVTALKLGGTAATSSGETTITGGSQMTTVATSVTITGSNPMAADRYGIGNAGLKKEQLQNGLQTINIKMDSEFSQTELYSLYTAGTPVPMQMTFTGPTIGGGNSFLFDIILPSCILKKAPPSVSGPDIVQMSTEWEAEWDESNPPIQIKIVSTESSAI